MTITVFIDLPGGERRACTANPGDTLLKAAQGAGVDLEGACGAALACATCHLVIAPDWYAKLPGPSTEESEMLSLATGRTRTSRLSCQIKLSEGRNGLVAKALK